MPYAKSDYRNHRAQSEVVVMYIYISYMNMHTYLRNLLLLNRALVHFFCKCICLDLKGFSMRV